jgi:hypothetical protein
MGTVLALSPAVYGTCTQTAVCQMCKQPSAECANSHTSWKAEVVAIILSERCAVAQHCLVPSHQALFPPLPPKTTHTPHPSCTPSLHSQPAHLARWFRYLGQHRVVCITDRFHSTFVAVLTRQQPVPHPIVHTAPPPHCCTPPPPPPHPHSPCQVGQVS